MITVQVCKKQDRLLNVETCYVHRLRISFWDPVANRQMTADLKMAQCVAHGILSP